jgi:hypothetical protein
MLFAKRRYAKMRIKSERRAAVAAHPKVFLLLFLALWILLLFGVGVL